MPSGAALPPLPAESQLRASGPSEYEQRVETELSTLRERVQHAEARLSEAVEKGIKAADAARDTRASLERQNEELRSGNAMLQADKKRLEAELASTDGGTSNLRMQEMQEKIMRQIGAMRLESAGAAQEQVALGGGAAGKPPDAGVLRELQQLRAENLRLKQAVPAGGIAGGPAIPPAGTACLSRRFSARSC